MQFEDVGFGSWLRENSEIEFANGNFVLTSIILKNKSAGDSCRDKTIEKTIPRTFRARTFSRSLGQTEKNSVRAYVFRFTPELGHCSSQSACLKRAKPGSRCSPVSSSEIDFNKKIAPARTPSQTEFAPGSRGGCGV
jgi:hypothetical protein